MAENRKPNGALDLELDETVALGNYANLAIISHSATEFILDFATLLPGLPKPKVQSRVILTPEHAKRLMYSLHEKISRYETNVRMIEISHPDDETPNEGFGTKIGEA